MTHPVPPADDPDVAAQIDAVAGGWVRAMGLRFTYATRHEVRAELVVAEVHLQPYGLVHGGVYCGIVESLASVGAALESMRSGRWIVGVENTTRFLKATRAGVLTAVGRPVSVSDTQSVWQVDIHDAGGTLVASGSVTAKVLPLGAKLAGAEVTVAGMDTASARVDSPAERR